ncbi:MAG: hypothetical protein OEZ04_05715 [Nitrospinota bacterium]|nr:hypothetical protein [Nitrospinota bacterium]
MHLGGSTLLKQGILWLCPVVVILLMTGCVTGSSPKYKDDLDSLKNQVWSLEKQTAAVNLRLAQNNSEIGLLGEKVKRLENAVNSLRDAIIRSGGPQAGLKNTPPYGERRLGKVLAPAKP